MSDIRSTSSKGIVALIILALSFGLTAIYARYLSAGAGVFEQWYLRFTVATITALIVFRKQIRFDVFRKLPRREWLLLLVRVISGGVIAVGLYTLASQQAKIGAVAFMQAVPFLAILSVFLMHEKLTIQKAALVFVAFIGVVIVGVKDFSDLTSFNLGEFYSLLSTLFFAFTFISRKWHSNILNNTEITTAMLAMGAIMNYLMSLAIYHRALPTSIEWTPMYLFVLVFAGMVGTLNVFLQNYGFEHVSGIVGGLILNLEQVFGPLCGFIFYRESLSAKEVFGGAIIVFAVAVIQWIDYRRPAKATA